MEAVITNIVTYIFLSLYVYSIFTIITVILLENRNPVKSLSWIIALLMVPILGIIFYIFFGQDYRRRKIISKNSIKTVQERPFHTFDLNQLTEKGIPNTLYKTIKLLYGNCEAPTYGSNKVDLFIDGKSTFDAIFKDIESAKNHVHIEFYILDNDTIGNQLRDLLIRKASEGVRIRIIYDYLGSYRLSKSYIGSLKDAGIYIQPFLPFSRATGYGKFNYRNHRKIIVVDGKIGYTGGVNIADRYYSGNKLGQWRDTQVRIEGAAVQGLQNAFLIDWYFVDNKIITAEKYYPTPEQFGDNLIQIVSSGPDTDWENIMQGVVNIINSASRYIYIHTPYFLPTESILTALEIAALSGVDVRIIIPEKSDTHLTSAASRSYFHRILEAGIKIYLYRENFLHSKAIVVDDMVSTVGTANMDVRSYEQNFEVNAFIYDEETAMTLRNYFEEDLKSCVELHLESWKRRHRREKLKESFARLFSPLL